MLLTATRVGRNTATGRTYGAAHLCDVIILVVEAQVGQLVDVLEGAASAF